MTRILALIDGSLYAPSVCDHAAWAAKSLDADVTLLHVLQKRHDADSDLSGNIGLGARSSLLEDLARLDAERAKLAKSQGRAILEDATSRLVEAGVADPVARLRHGELVHELEQAEVGSDLVVIGKRGESANFDTLRLGSHLEQAIRISSIPVLIASRVFQPVRHVLIAHDGGRTSTAAIDYVAGSPFFSGAHITLLTVGTDTTGVRLALNEARQRLTESGHEVDIQITPGRADSVIAESVSDRNIDLLVMGAFSHSRIRNMFVGSTTTETIRACHIPILMIR